MALQPDATVTCDPRDRGTSDLLQFAVVEVYEGIDFEEDFSIEEKNEG